MIRASNWSRSKTQKGKHAKWECVKLLSACSVVILSIILSVVINLIAVFHSFLPFLHPMANFFIGHRSYVHATHVYALSDVMQHQANVICRRSCTLARAFCIAALLTYIYIYIYTCIYRYVYTYIYIYIIHADISNSAHILYYTYQARSAPLAASGSVVICMMFILVYYIILPPSTAPPSHCTPL